ncbi:MAG: hypothetical protein CLLPBCKN_007674 [Chroococcidiopsis cubana SAG 39.79]|nr:hypothetical protein [Chroococcidiopsis cubana SAG 39.79]
MAIERVGCILKPPLAQFVGSPPACNMKLVPLEFPHALKICT